MPKNYCIMQIWAESGKSALPICNYSQILYQFLTFTQNLKRSPTTSAFTVLTATKFTLTVFSMPAAIICGFYLETVQQRNNCGTPQKAGQRIFP